jgi:phosphate transport system substrate-binding protein
MKKLFGVFLVLALAGSVFAGGRQGQEEGDVYTITIAGSTSVNPLMELLIAEYLKTHDKVKFTVSATGSGDGIKSAAEGIAEIGMSSRELTPAEIGTGLDELIIAIDGIAVIVNNNNPVSNLSRDQIRAVYTGETGRWEELGETAQGKSGRIAVISREPGSGTRGAFEELLGFQDKMVQGAVEFDGTGAIKAEVSRNVDAIGYISLGSTDSSIKPLFVDSVEAVTANVKAGTYKIARPFILLTKKGATLNPETRTFLDWIMQPAGQEIVKTSWISVR